MNESATDRSIWLWASGFATIPPVSGATVIEWEVFCKNKTECTLTWSSEEDLLWEQWQKSQPVGHCHQLCSEQCSSGKEVGLHWNNMSKWHVSSPTFHTITRLHTRTSEPSKALKKMAFISLDSLVCPLLQILPPLPFHGAWLFRSLRYRGS